MFSYAGAARAAVLGLLACLTLSACGDDDGGSPDNGDAALDGGFNADGSHVSPAPDGSSAQGDGGNPANNGMDSGAENKDAVYALLMALPDPDGVNLWYVAVQRELDFAAIKRDDLRTFPGNSGITATAGHLFHGDDLTPTLTKYRITQDLAWEQVGDKIFFGAYPLPTGQLLDFHGTNFKDDQTAYHHYGEDGAFRIQWNPTAGRIVKGHTDSNLPPSNEQLALHMHGDLDRIRRFEGPVMEPFHNRIPGTYIYGDTSYIAVYDENSHVEKNVITVAQCPGLEHSSRDEQGNVYFSTFNNIPGAELFGKKPSACVVRAKADGTLDPAFPQTDMRAFTGGHYVVHFSYFRDGKAVGYVLHEDRLGRTFEGEPPEAYADEVWANAAAWEFELLDLEKRTSKPFIGIQGDVGPASSALVRIVDGRGFYFLPNEDGTSAAYELSADGSAKFVSNVIGQVYNIFRLR